MLTLLLPVNMRKNAVHSYIGINKSKGSFFGFLGQIISLKQSVGRVTWARQFSDFHNGASLRKNKIT